MRQAVQVRHLRITDHLLVTVVLLHHDKDVIDVPAGGGAAEFETSVGFAPRFGVATVIHSVIASKQNEALRA